MNNFFYKKFLSITILEFLVGLTIFLFVSFSLFSIIIYSNKILYTSFLLSNLIDESSYIKSLIEADIKNSDYIYNCSNNCRFNRNNKIYSWERCVDNASKICKYLINNYSPNEQKILIFRTSDLLNFTDISFSFFSDVLTGTIIFKVSEEIKSLNSDLFDQNFFKQFTIELNNKLI